MLSTTQYDLDNKCRGHFIVFVCYHIYITCLYQKWSLCVPLTNKQNTLYQCAKCAKELRKN